MGNNAGWLASAMLAAKPKQSVIGVLVKNLGGEREGRSRKQLHASDITKEDFCPRQWAIYDLQQLGRKTEYLSLALHTTFDLGNATARTLIHEWAGSSVIGNWKCLRCNDHRTMCSKPTGVCYLAPGKNKDHLWEYVEPVFQSSEFKVSGSIDAVFDLGSPYLRVVELKTIAAQEFETLVAPKPEHRIRTSLYLKLIAESDSVYKTKFDLQYGSILYISRGFGKKNPQWNDEIMPFKEFEIKRDDSLVKEPVQKAKALTIFRETGEMPSGICQSINDKMAKGCDVCKHCFSGDLPATVDWSVL